MLYLVYIEKTYGNGYPYEEVIFTNTSEKAAVDMAEHLRQNNDNFIWVERRTLDATMTYQNCITVWAAGTRA